MQEIFPDISPLLNQLLNDVRYFIPEIYLTVTFIVVLLADLLIGKNSDRYCRAIALAGVVIALFKTYEQYALFSVDNEVFNLFSGMLVLHVKAVSFKMIIGVLSLLLLIYFPLDNKLAAHQKGLSDLYTISIGALLGMFIMVMAANMLSVYLAIEMVSIASYLMVAYRSENALSAEAGLKYVLFGAAASAVLLYGISLLYGFTGTLNLFDAQFVNQLANINIAGLGLALGFVLIGVGFKLGFVPVHFWVPDVYQGAATPITAWLSTAPKIAAFALLINVITPFIAVGPQPGLDLRLILGIAGIITMVAGNFAAIGQNSVKRMLAYSSIGHTGFALISIVTFSQQGLSSLIYYLAVYALANIAALLLASYFSNQAGTEEINGYKGLGFKYPLASVCFVVVLISLTGLPVTAGFTGKLFVFSAAYSIYQQQHDWVLLAMMITGAVTTVVSLFYYIKIPLFLFLKKGPNVIEAEFSGKTLAIFALALSVLLVLLGVFPDWLYSAL